ncbi:MAG: hypothetical protein KDA60_14505 [Planctomycetales bacterium]|nr:hypothetical protein [Planctomycetales bacterium]
MFLHRLLQILLGLFALLIVTVAVLSGACSLLDATGDAGAARITRGCALGSILLLGIDVLLLVGVMGWRLLESPPTNAPPVSTNDEKELRADRATDG